ncbi:MAG: hypothetical protein M1568_04545 [Acidobacteria bacterium]|nr:hypothetical protein [Acidobacteriota bacterium]
MDIIGIAVVALHGIVIFSIILWFGLAKPKTWAEFRLRFRCAFFRCPKNTTIAR